MTWDTLFAALVALGAVAFDRWLSSQADRATSTEVRNRHLAALAAEIEYCARLASTYLSEPYAAPLYRFPRTVYDTVYPTLVSETLVEADITALTSFYSQVDQMNRGLDAADRFRAGRQDIELNQEAQRLRKKAEEMRHPEALQRPPGAAGFYNHAIEAIRRPRA